MKSMLAVAILLSSISVMAGEKIANCTRKSNAEFTMQIAYETQNLQVKRVVLQSPSIDGAEAQSTTLRPIGQVPWQNFAFLVSLPLGKTLLVPFSVFTPSASAEVILDGSIQYKCK